MIEFNYPEAVPKDFTGVCKVLYDNTIRYYKDGALHRQDGPACEYPNGSCVWFLNGKLHKEDGPAVKAKNNYKEYYYNDAWYSNIESDDEWVEKVRCLKLEIFK